jgi:hypothetical protein
MPSWIANLKNKVTTASYLLCGRCGAHSVFVCLQILLGAYHHHHHHHHHRQNSPFRAIAFLRRFCQSASGFHFFGFRNNDSFAVQGRRPCVQPPKPGGSGPRIYIPQEQGSSVIPTGTGFPFRRLLRLAGLRWRYSNPPPHEKLLFILF